MTSNEHIDIIIPSRGSTLGLWATLSACEVQLENKDISYKYTVVLNGEEKLDPDTKSLVHFLEQSKSINEIVICKNPLSPPQARQIGSDKGTGKYIYFFDNHCIPCNSYFERSIADFEHFDIDLLHSSYQYYPGDTIHYHYSLKLKHNFWGESGMQLGDKVRPSRIAAGGHGGFAVKRSTWEAIDGYSHDPNLFIGYGGEELYTDLRLWLLGYSVWIDPKVKHHHYAGNRGYPRHASDAYYVNQMVTANIIGGEKWLYTTYESFSSEGKWVRPISEKSWYDLMIEAYERSAAHCADLESKRTKTLEELLDWFKTESIPC